MKLEEFVTQVRGRLIVSCQALPDEPLHGAGFMAGMARAAKMGGAAAIRANGPADIAAIKQAVELPVIGLYKDGDSGVYITPSLEHVQAVVDAGADIIAIDATERLRPDGMTTSAFIKAIKANFAQPLLADVSILAEGHAAVDSGADLVAPTLSGYTDYSPQQEEPDFALLKALVAELSIPIIAEGRISTPQEAQRALQLGALAVVVGSAITRPQLITQSFVRALDSIAAS